MYRVTATDDEFAIERQQTPNEWVVIGRYADRAVAEEIVEIANSEPPEGNGTGNTPHSAIPMDPHGMQRYLS